MSTSIPNTSIYFLSLSMSTEHAKYIYDGFDKDQ